MLSIPQHKTGRFVAASAVAAFLAAGVAAAMPVGAGVIAASQDRATRAADGLARFENQTIAWHGCQDGVGDQIGALMDAAGGHCGEVTVPLDYNRPGGQMITLAVSRITATDSNHRRGVLFTNGGGPGGPGIGQPLNFTENPDIHARYDMIGIDPRFTWRSTPLRCEWASDTFLRGAGPDRRTFKQSVNLARDQASGCLHGNQMSLLPYATTRNTARDMDLVRAILGEPKISYESGSYGAYLGAVYLQMFPNRVDRFVLDSSPDPTLFGPNPFVHNGPAVTAALNHFAAWTAGRNKTYGLGATAVDVLAAVSRIARAAERHPLRVGAFEVDAHTVPYIMLIYIAEDGDQFYSAAADMVRTLRDAAGGATVMPSLAFNELLTGLLTGSGPASDRIGLPILCGDRDVSRNPETYFQDIEAHRADDPFFGPLFHNITPCAFWPTRPTEPPTTIHSNAPVLMVANAGDPITPYSGQLVMHQALTGSRLVTQPGAFRHQAYMNGSTCVDDAVNRYLTDGVRPVGDTTCPA
jgi:pimeloyl-ACP methyl ester carboxylesterase